jgi:acetyl esterase/lipase
MNFEQYQTSMDAELRTGFVQMMARSGNTPGQQHGPSSLVARRQQVAAFAAAARKHLPPNDRVTSEDRRVPGPVGAPDVSVRLYTPSPKKETMSAILWLHGGSFTLGNLDQDEATCQRLAEEVGGVVVSVEYRLAPERPFPAALEDGYAALRWMVTSAAELGIDSGRIAVAGVSSGGCLAAAVALLARDRQEVRLAFCLLIYPALDDRLRTPSSHEIAEPSMVGNREELVQGWKAYLGSEQQGDTPAYAAPARAVHVAGLPPSYIMTGELDAVRDESIAYAMRLMQAAIPTELHVYPGAFHGFEKMVPTAAISKRATAEYIAALRQALDG